ncbi:MAG: 50S ribosomal protein L16 [Candidatus Woesearchaeota archaeon]
MAKTIRACAWRRLERPYTRKSKYRAKSFVRSVPANKIVKFEMGNTSKEFEYVVSLRSDVDIQIRHNALEAGRKSANRKLETALTRKGYKLKIAVYPHHILRNNPLASGAGADRMSTGMKMSFGKAVGIAARVMKGQKIIEAHVDEKDIALAKKAMTLARHKFPRGGYIDVEKKLLTPVLA